MFKLSRRSYDRLTGVDQRLIYLAEEAIKITPVDFAIAWMGGRRTAEEQNELFKSEVSKKDGFVKLSKHQSGQAFDIIPYMDGKVNLDEIYWSMAIAAILITAKRLELEVEAGAFWKWRDIPHIQLV